MELILSSAALSLLVLVAAFVEFLVSPAPHGAYHGGAFPAGPKRTLLELPPDPAAEYDRAA